MKILKGANITEIGVHYENLVICSKKGKMYFISEEELLKLVQKAEFKLEKKKTRTWATINNSYDGE